MRNKLCIIAAALFALAIIAAVIIKGRKRRAFYR